MESFYTMERNRLAYLVATESCSAKNGDQNLSNNIFTEVYYFSHSIESNQK